MLAEPVLVRSELLLLELLSLARPVLAGSELPTLAAVALTGSPVVCSHWQACCGVPAFSSSGTDTNMRCASAQQARGSKGRACCPAAEAGPGAGRRGPVRLQQQHGQAPHPAGRAASMCRAVALLAPHGLRRSSQAATQNPHPHPALPPALSPCPASFWCLHCQRIFFTRWGVTSFGLRGTRRRVGARLRPPHGATSRVVRLALGAERASQAEALLRERRLREGPSGCGPAYARWRLPSAAACAAVAARGAACCARLA